MEVQKLDSKKIYLSPEGRQELEEKKGYLEAILRNKIDPHSISNETTTNHGWHEVADEIEVNREKGTVQYELDCLKLAEDAKIYEDLEKHSTDGLDYGDTFTVELTFPDGRREEYTYLLVARIRVDFKEKGIVNLNSPLGRAIYAKKEHEAFEYGVTGNETTGTVKSIQKEIVDPAKAKVR